MPSLIDLRRPLRVLELLSAAPHGMSLAQLASQTRVPKSTMFRILHTLHQHQIILEDPERKLFTLGMKVLGWGHAALERIDYKAIAHPYLVKLSNETRESFYLAVLDHDEVILIDRVDTPEVWKMVTRLGQRSPFHCTATGLVIAAGMEEDAVDEMIEQHGLRKFTARTITSVQKLKRRLKEVHRLGAAFPNLEKLAQKAQFARAEELFAAIGRGDVTAREIMALALDEGKPKAEEELWQIRNLVPAASGVLVVGVGDLMTSMAKCCKPVPPDPIIGFVTRGRGVAIHRQDCTNIVHMPDSRKERLLPASWGSRSGRGYEVDMEVEANDRQGLLRDRATRCSRSCCSAPIRANSACLRACTS